MDPYLENRQWTSLHTALSVEIAGMLSDVLPPRYLARPNERIVVATPGPDDVDIRTASQYPDAFVVDQGPGAAMPGAVALATPPLAIETLMPEPIPHVTVEITDADGRRLVTAIEVLSPTNKRGDGRDEYLAKRRRTLVSSVHLVEIDLLRRGHRVPSLKPLPRFPYFVFVARANRRPMMDVWPIRLNEQLPKVPIPLLPGDADVWLDLQTALNTVYRRFRYDRSIDYSQPPHVPLKGAAAEWTRKRIETWRELREGGEGQA
jgi:hypothetical protein